MSWKVFGFSVKKKNRLGMTGRNIDAKTSGRWLFHRYLSANAGEPNFSCTWRSTLVPRVLNVTSANVNNPREIHFSFPFYSCPYPGNQTDNFILSTGPGRIKTSWLKTWRELRLRPISPTRSYSLLHPLGLLKTSIRNDTRSEVVSSRCHSLDNLFSLVIHFFSHRINKHPSKLYTLKSLPVVFIGLNRVCLEPII